MRLIMEKNEEKNAKKRETEKEELKQEKKTTNNAKKKTTPKTASTTNKSNETKTKKEQANQKTKDEKSKEEKQIKEKVETPKTEEAEKTSTEQNELSKQEQPKENSAKGEKEENIDFESSKFDGKLLQLIGWRILGALVTIFTLGICYPFALCFVYKWQMKHTKINGKQLVFDGKGHQLLGRWILWMLLSIITLGIYSLWIPVQKNKWIIKHTHYQDTEVQEENNKSQFTGTTPQYIGWLFLGIILTICSFGLLYPCALCLMYNWRIKHTVIDGDNMEFDGRSMQLWGLWIKWTLLSIITLGIYSLWIPISLLKWETKHTNKKGLSKKPYSVGKAIIAPIIIAIVTVIITAVGIGIYMSAKDGVLEQAKLTAQKSKDNEKDKENSYYNTKTDKLEYTKLNEFSDSVAWVQGEDNNFYLIDKTGKSIFKLRKTNGTVTTYNVNNFKNGYAQIKDSEGTKIIDKKGNVVLKQDEDKYDEIEYTNDGFAKVTVREEDYLGTTRKMGIVNLETGKEVLEPSEKYGSITSLGEGMFKYVDDSNKEAVLLNAKNGKSIKEEKSEGFISGLDNFTNGYTIKRKDGTFSLIDTDCNITIINVDDYTKISNSDIGVFSDGLIGIGEAFYDAKGNKAFEFSRENVNNNPKFVDGYALVTFYNGSKNYYTIMDKQGNFLFEPKEYKSKSGTASTSDFSIYNNQKELYPGAYLLTSENGRWQVLDAEGDTVIQLEKVEEPRSGIDENGIMLVYSSYTKETYYKTIEGKTLEITKLDE